MNPSLSRTENSWERGASFTTNVAVSPPKSENTILLLQALHTLTKVIENNTVEKNISKHHPGKLWRRLATELYALHPNKGFILIKILAPGTRES